MKESSKIDLNDDYSFSEDGKVIASFSLATGVLHILQGHGSKRQEMLKSLLDQGIEVGSHQMVTEIDFRPEEEKQKSAEANKPAKKAARKTAKKVAVSELADEEETPKVMPHKEEGARETNIRENRPLNKREAELEARELEVAMRERRVAEREQAVNADLGEKYRPVIEEVERPEGMGAREFRAKFAPRGRPEMGDKDPYVLEWCRLNLTSAEYDNLYGHRLIPE